MENIKRLLAFFTLVFVLVFAFASCSSSNNGDTDYSPNKGDGMEDAGSSSVETTDERKLIKTVNETIETKNFDDFLTAVETAVTSNGGYIENKNYVGNTNSDRYASLKIRVPADKLDAFTKSVGEKGTVTDYSETQDDVTLQYVDITSRIETLEAEESALLGILASASTTADILTIRAQLEDVQAELASLRAQKKVLDSQVEFSTVNLHVYEVSEEFEPTFGARIKRTFNSSLDFLATLFTGIAVFFIGGSPIIILLALIACAIIIPLAISSKKRKNKANNNDQNNN